MAANVLLFLLNEILKIKVNVVLSKYNECYTMHAVTYRIILNYFLYILFRRGRLNTQNTPLGIKHPANTQKSSRYGNAFSRVCLCVSVCLSVMLKLLKALTYKQFIFGTEVCL